MSKTEHPTPSHTYYLSFTEWVTINYSRSTANGRYYKKGSIQDMPISYADIESLWKIYVHSHPI